MGHIARYVRWHASRCSHMILFARSLNSTNRKLSSRFFFYRFFLSVDLTQERSQRTKHLFVRKQQQKKTKNQKRVVSFSSLFIIFRRFFCLFLIPLRGTFCYR